MGRIYLGVHFPFDMADARLLAVPVLVCVFTGRWFAAQVSARCLRNRPSCAADSPGWVV